MNLTWKNIYKVWKTQKNAAVIDISGTELQDYNAYRKSNWPRRNAHAYDDFLVLKKACHSCLEFFERHRLVCQP